MGSILEMKGIDKAFNGVPVLKKADFTLEKGHVHALVGGNGAGKSTLMKIFTGVYSKDAGEVLLDGQKVNFNSYDDASNAGIRMIFQELSLVPTLKVYENIFLNHEKRKRMRALDKDEMCAQATLLLKELGLDISPEAIVGDLSVGICQMVEIAKALSMNAKILVFDEPTASLSETEVDVLFKTIRRLKEQGVSMVYISHRMNEILEISDEISVLRDGQVILSEKSGNLTIDDIIKNMLGDSASKSFEWVERKYPPQDEIMLEAEHLKINDMLDDISFHVRKGEIIGIAGLMGSGRSEIVQAIFGIDKFESGSIKVENKEVRINSVKDAIDAGIALVPEDRRRTGLVLAHSVKQNTILPSIKKLRSKLFIDEKSSDELVNKRVNELNIITDSISKIVSLLSGGNQQKIVIAKWLSTNPKVLLLDEPTAGIDVGAKGEITEIIRNYADEGNSAVVISSELTEMMAVCDRILILYKGKITGELMREEIGSEEVLQHAIQG